MLGAFDQPWAWVGGSGKGTLHMSKQGIGKDGIVNACHIFCDKGLIFKSETVECLSDQLFANTGLSRYQYWFVGSGNGLQILEDSDHWNFW